jgi:hypothetical protein
MPRRQKATNGPMGIQTVIFKDDPQPARRRANVFRLVQFEDRDARVTE